MAKENKLLRLLKSTHHHRGEQPRDEHGRFLPYDAVEEEKGNRLTLDDIAADEADMVLVDVEKIKQLLKDRRALKKALLDSGKISSEIQNQALDQIADHGNVVAAKAPPSAVSMYSSYKMYAHSAKATVLKYIIHRIENVEKYRNIESGKALDKEFLQNLETQATWARATPEKRGRQPTIHELHNILAGAPHLISEVIEHKNRLYDSLSKHKEVRNIDNEPHVALARSLARGAPRVKDPLIASYDDSGKFANTKKAGVSLVSHYHWVPLKNIWYSYDMGPKEAVPSHRFPAQDEFIVSPHELKTAYSYHLKKLFRSGAHQQVAMERKAASLSSLVDRLHKAIVIKDKETEWFKPSSISPHGEYSTIKSYKVGNLWHHVAEFSTSRAKYALHVLSSEEDPYDQAGTIGSLETETVGGATGIKSVAVDKQYRRQGYGTVLYGLAARHHGTVHSGASVSESAQNIYRKISEHPNFAVTIGTPGDPKSLNSITYKGSAPKPDKIQRGLGKSGDDRLCKSGGDKLTPREKASKELEEQAKSSEYAFARPSKFQNVGEDLLGSARHRRGGRAPASIRSDVGFKLTNRSRLLKQEPPDILSKVNKDNWSAALTAHNILSSFPAKPVVHSSFYNKDDPANSLHEYRHETGKVVQWHPGSKYPSGVTPPGVSGLNLVKVWSAEDVAEAARGVYVDAYRRVRDALEHGLNTGMGDRELIRHVRTEIGNVAKEAMARDIVYGPRSGVVNSLIRFSNSLTRASFFAKHSLLKKAAEKAGHLGDGEKMAEHVRDLIEGKSLDSIFGEGVSGKKLSSADLYVRHVTRVGPDHGMKTDEDFLHFLTNKAKLRGLQWGNSVTDSERKHHLQHVAYALKDLAHAIDIPDELVSYNGRLGLAIGARGASGMMAHYEPKHVVINLTRKSGTGGLAHEWGHFFDHIMTKVTTGANEFGSRSYKHPEPNDEDGKAISAAYSGINSVFNSIRERIYDKWNKDKAFQESVSYSELGGYWLSPIEMFARAFEGYVDHKMAQKGISNTYLVGKIPKNSIFLTNDEVKRVAPHFDALFSAVKASKYLRKSMFDAVEKLAKSENVPKVASVAVVSGDHLLMGKRRDNGKITLPGGHFKPGETPIQAARRELFEETGISSGNLHYLGKKRIRCEDGVVRDIYAFCLFGKYNITNKKDPDEECKKWYYVDTSGGLPEEVLSNLHSPRNAVLNLIGLQKW